MDEFNIAIFRAEKLAQTHQKVSIAGATILPVWPKSSGSCASIACRANPGYIYYASHLSHTVRSKEPIMSPPTKATEARPSKRPRKAATAVDESLATSPRRAATPARSLCGAQVAPKGMPASVMAKDFLDVYNFPPQQRIELIRAGVSAKDVGRLAKSRA